MSVHGDTTYVQETLAKQLIEFEVDIVKKVKDPLILAKSYVCLAHDWYQVDMEEEGNRLLEKAEAVSPGYFTQDMIKHTKEDPQFDYLVKSLVSEIGWILLSRLQERKKIT